MENQEIEKNIEELKKGEKVKEFLYKNKAKAKNLLEDKEKLEHTLESLEKKLSKVPVAGKYLQDVPVFISLVRAYVNKEYTEIPLGSIIAIISALIYVFNGFDFIPDLVPGVGFIDDAAVIAFAYSMVHDDVEEYKVWREANKK